MERTFEVSENWMAACGHAGKPRTFPVKSIETNMIGRKGMDALLTLDTSALGATGPGCGEWKVFAGRGRFVE